MKIRSSLLLSLALAALGSPVYAAADIAPSYPISSSTQTTGQNQYYTVVFDGEGETAVAAKLTFQNATKDPIDSVDIEIPGTVVRLITAVQEISQRPLCPPDQPLPSYLELNNIRPPTPCDDYGYSLPYYYLLTPKEDHLSESTKVTLALPKSINSQEQFSVLLYYKAVGYVQKHAGLFKFFFNTIKMPYDVQDVRVAINTQEGLYLAGGKAETQYRPNFAPIAAPSALPASGAASESLRDFSQQIAHEQGFIKQTSGLDPWESFTVQGKYAPSRFLLALPSILAAILSILIAIALLVLAFKKLRRIMPRVSTKTGGSQLFLANPWIQASFSGFAVAFVIAMLSVVFVWLTQNLSRYARYGTFSQLFGMLMFLSLIGFGLLIFFGVPLYFFKRYRWQVMLLALAVELGALFLISLLLLLALGSMPGTTSPPPLPL